MCGDCVKVCPARVPLLKYTNVAKRAISEESAANEEEFIKINPDKKLKRKRMVKNILAVVFTIVIFILSSGFLTVINNNTEGMISLQKDAETLTILQQVFNDAAFYSYSVDTEIYTVYNDRHNKIGYAMYGEDYGYRGRLSVIVGLEDREIIHNIAVIFQMEDYSYWERMVIYDFFDQFIGLRVEECYPSYEWLPGGVDSTSGATVSSVAVTQAVRDAILDKLEYLD